MDYPEFIKQVLLVTDNEDYQQNEDLIEMVHDEYRQTFIECLQLGYKIKSSYKALDTIARIKNDLSFSMDQIAFMLPYFEELFFSLNPDKRPSDDPMVDITAYIDRLENYQELNFIREHAEIAMDNYFKKLYEKNPAALRTPWKKFCPACGHFNDMQTIKCSKCGFKNDD